MNQFEPYVGKPIEVLLQACRDAGKTVRITVLDGKAVVITRDVNVNRLNISVSNNIVTAIGGFG